MEKRVLAMLIGLIIVLAIVFAVFVSYPEEADSKDKVILNASTEGPLSLESVVEDIKKGDTLKTYLQNGVIESVVKE